MDKKNITEKIADSYLALKIKCGFVFYAEIPKFYEYILGVTGTQKDLHEKIYESLKYYKFIS